MSSVVVTDTGPLIALAVIGLLPTLSTQFSVVYVPDAVISEATFDSRKPGARAILQALEEKWIVHRSVEISGRYYALVELLDRGEVEVLSLAGNLNAVALLDERRGRKVASKYGIKVTGTAAVLIKAKLAGEIPRVKPLLEELALHGYRLSSSLITEVLERCGE